MSSSSNTTNNDSLLQTMDHITDLLKTAQVQLDDLAKLCAGTDQLPSVDALALEYCRNNYNFVQIKLEIMIILRKNNLVTQMMSF